MTGFLLLAGAAVLLVAGAELFTANLAAVRERPAIAAGDAIGTNITMLTLVLGLGALLRPLPFGRLVRTYAAVASAGGLVAALALIGGVTRIEGAGLVAVYVLFVALTWRLERRPSAIGEVVEMETTEHASQSSSG